MSVLVETRIATRTLDVVIPVHNEERTLVASVAAVRGHLARLPFPATVTIADNASTDSTPVLARDLARRHADIRVVSLAQKGRGRALKRAWTSSGADVLVYMDVDLSTDLNALLPLVAPLLSGHSDLAIGSRLSRTSRTVRGPKREIVSRSYNHLLRGTLRVRFADAQCGFKAIRRDVAEQLLPLVEDDEWFFDTELLVVAERAGLRIHEVPVDWIDDPDSRVDVLRTAMADLRGIVRLGGALLRGRLPLAEVAEALSRATERSAHGTPTAQVAVFSMVGLVSTLLYGFLFVLVREPLGPQSANVFALVATAVANTAANRRLTFGLRGRAGAARHHLQGLLILGLGLATTSGALSLLREGVGGDHAGLEAAVLTGANLLVTVGRFVLLRTWIFRTPPGP